MVTACDVEGLKYDLDDRLHRTPAESLVLLVETPTVLSKAMVRTLERAGLSVKVASSYAKARRWVDQTDVRFNAAILDHQLPDGDSRELVSALAGRKPSCRSLILTSQNDFSLLRRQAPQ